jgi:histone H3/H4
MTVEMIEGVDVALKVQEACRKATGRALARLAELQTAADPKVRSEATEALNSTVARLLENVLDRLVETAREGGLAVSRRSTEQPGDKPS